MTHLEKTCIILNALEEYRKYQVYLQNDYSQILVNIANNEEVSNPFYFLIDTLYSHMKAGGLIG